MNYAYLFSFGVLLLIGLFIHRLTVWGEATRKREEEEAKARTVELLEEDGTAITVFRESGTPATDATTTA